MTVVNHAAAGDHQGMIKFKNWKKGLYIDESSLFKKKLTFINKETVESYEDVKNDSGSSKKGALTKGVLGGAVFGLGGAIAGGTSSKNQSKYMVSIIFKDGTKALCELDAHTYEVLLKLMY